ncbi:MAG: prolipoprotein diacylglyceryl transferase family protein, partial [Ilumatobacteraceae bacterium]
MTTVLASIPSPSSGALTIGPLSIHAYGLMIALGVIAAVWLLGRRLEVAGVGTREDASSIAVWAVIAGVIGSRLYHVVTDWELFEHDLIRIPQIWRGGLGIPG